MRRVAIAIACVLGVAAAPGAAAAAPGLEIHAGGQTTMLSAAQIAAQTDVPGGDYGVRATPGADPIPTGHPAALSVHKLLLMIGADPARTTYVAIAHVNGQRTVLPAADLSDPPPFADGPPIFWVDGSTTRFMRPLGGDPNDVNAPDDLGSEDDQPLVVDVLTGALLGVTVHASPARVGAHAPVRLSATVAGAQPGERLSYVWHFGDGATESGPAVSHRYAAAGRYDAYVEVTGDQGSGGASPPVAIQVGRPVRGGGHAGGGGTGRPRQAPAVGRRRGATRGSTQSGATQPTAPTPPPLQPAPAPQPAPAATPRPAARPRPAPAPPRARRPPRVPARRPAAPGGTPVRGVLLAARDSAALERALTGRPAAPPAAAAAAGAATAEAPPRPLGWLAGVLVALTLVAVGAARERRGMRRP